MVPELIEPVWNLFFLYVVAAVIGGCMPLILMAIYHTVREAID